MKASLVFAVVAMTTVTLFAEAPQPSADLRKTLSAAQQQQKLGFILMGRPSCGNCNATKAMIRDGKIPVTTADYVMADLDIDDPKTEAEFMRKYGKEKFGEVLPFVVITDSRGKAVASSGGYKNADQWNALLADAKSKAKTAGADTGGAAGGKAGDPSWPFKTPARQ